MDKFVGTWKAVGTIEKDGKEIHQKVPIKFTFNEDGTGKFRIIIIPGKFTWVADGDTVTAHGKNGKKDAKFTLEDDRLRLYSDSGDICILQKVE